MGASLGDKLAAVAASAAACWLCGPFWGDEDLAVVGMTIITLAGSAGADDRFARGDWLLFLRASFASVHRAKTAAVGGEVAPSGSLVALGALITPADTECTIGVVF